MLNDKRGDAPRIVNIGVWTAAVAGAFVFALTVGISLYNTVNTPISADTTTPSCPAGTKKLAVNNYPTTYFKTKVDGKLPLHKPFEDAMNNNWRCSNYCVPIKDGEDDTTAQKNFFTGATMGGLPVNIASTEKEFIGLLGTANQSKMVTTVILASTKKSCEGAAEGSTSGASAEYAELKLKDATASTQPIVANETVKKLEEEVKQRTAAEIQDLTEAGKRQDLTIPSTVSTDSGISSSNNLGEEIDAFKWCKAVIKKFTSDSNPRLVGANLIERDQILNIDSSTLKTLDVARKSKERCWRISDFLQNKLETWAVNSPNDQTKTSPSGPLSGIKTNGFNIYVSGYIDYAPKKPSDNTIVCGFLTPLDGKYLKGTTYNRCATSSNGAFNLSLGFGKSDFFTDNGKPRFKQLWVYAVNTGGILGGAKNQLYIINLDSKFANLTAEQKSKGAMTINIGGGSSQHDALNGRIIEDGNVNPTRPSTEQLRDQVFNKTKVNCLYNR